MQIKNKAQNQISKINQLHSFLQSQNKAQNRNQSQRQKRWQNLSLFTQSINQKPKVKCMFQLQVKLNQLPKVIYLPNQLQNTIILSLIRNRNPIPNQSHLQSMKTLTRSQNQPQSTILPNQNPKSPQNIKPPSQNPKPQSPIRRQLPQPPRNPPRRKVSSASYPSSRNPRPQPLRRKEQSVRCHMLTITKWHQGRQLMGQYQVEIHMNIKRVSMGIVSIKKYMVTNWMHTLTNSK